MCRFGYWSLMLNLNSLLNFPNWLLNNCLRSFLNHLLRLNLINCYWLSNRCWYWDCYLLNSYRSYRGWSSNWCWGNYWCWNSNWCLGYNWCWGCNWCRSLSRNCFWGSNRLWYNNVLLLVSYKTLFSWSRFIIIEGHFKLRSKGFQIRDSWVNLFEFFLSFLISFLLFNLKLLNLIFFSSIHCSKTISKGL